MIISFIYESPLSCPIVHLGGEVAGDPSDPIGESNGERIDSEEVSGEEIA